MLLLEKYEYSPIDRVTTIDRKRHYKLPDGSSVPSVTTILDATKSKEKKIIANIEKKGVKKKPLTIKKK